MENLSSYLHQIPALQRLGDDGGHGRADAAKDHQVFGTVADGVEEGPQPLGVVTLQRGKEAESEREKDRHRSRAGRTQRSSPPGSGGSTCGPIMAERCYFYPFADVIPGFLKLSSNAASRRRDYKDADASALISSRSLL